MAWGTGSSRHTAGTKKPVGRIRDRGATVNLFTRQLATMLDAGVPLVKALEVLTRQQKQADFRQVLVAIANGVRAGNTLSDGLARFPRVFDHLYLNLVKAGEAGGILDVVLARLARFQEKTHQIKGKVQAAMVYPLIVALVACGIVGFLMTYVIPQFQNVFRSMLRGQALPPLTQFVIDLSAFTQSHWWALGAVPLALGAAWKGLKRTDRGRWALDGLLLALPLWGDLHRKVAIARFTRTFGTLVASGVPLLHALRSSSAVLRNRHICDALQIVHDRVRDGEPIARPLAETEIFPPMVSSMIEVGEATGRLGAMCERVADTYEEEVDNAVTALTRVVEPLMIVMLAVIVGTIVVALFLPIMSIIQNLNVR